MARARRSWLVKSEPSQYAWKDLVADGGTVWDGVRNAEARNHLAAMGVGDLALFYHSGGDKAVVGVARCRRAAYPDPTADDERWVAVDLAPVLPMVRPVTLSQVKADAALAGIALVTRSRLSVIPVSITHFRRILKLGQTSLPRGS